VTGNKVLGRRQGTNSEGDKRLIKVVRRFDSIGENRMKDRDRGCLDSATVTV
jgi:hypothetical protein